MTHAPRRILVTGVPRSGTTWVGRALGHSVGSRYLNEPDNETVNAYAIRAKDGLGRYPIVAATERGPRAYARLWEAAFTGARPPRGARAAVSDLLRRSGGATSGVPIDSNEPSRRPLADRLTAPQSPPDTDVIVVKSVFVGLCLDWILTRWQPDAVIVMKDPVNLVASWHRRGWRPPFDRHPVLRSTDPRRVLADVLPPGLPDQPADPLGRMAWQLGALTTAVRRQAARHEAVTLVQHERLCENPAERFKALLRQVSLDWSDEVDDYLQRSNTLGSGLYDTQRVAAEEKDSWRELEPAMADRARDVLSWFAE